MKIKATLAAVALLAAIALNPASATANGISTVSDSEPISASVPVLTYESPQVTTTAAEPTPVTTATAEPTATEPTSDPTVTTITTAPEPVAETPTATATATPTADPTATASPQQTQQVQAPVIPQASPDEALALFKGGIAVGLTTAEQETGFARAYLGTFAVNSPKGSNTQVIPSTNDPSKEYQFVAEVYGCVDQYTAPAPGPALFCFPPGDGSSLHYLGASTTPNPCATVTYQSRLYPSVIHSFRDTTAPVCTQ